MPPLFSNLFHRKPRHSSSSTMDPPKQVKATEPFPAYVDPMALPEDPPAEHGDDSPHTLSPYAPISDSAAVSHTWLTNAAESGAPPSGPGSPPAELRAGQSHTAPPVHALVDRVNDVLGPMTRDFAKLSHENVSRLSLRGLDGAENGMEPVPASDAAASPGSEVTASTSKPKASEPFGALAEAQAMIGEPPPPRAEKTEELKNFTKDLDSHRFTGTAGPRSRVRGLTGAQRASSSSGIISQGPERPLLTPEQTAQIKELEASMHEMQMHIDNILSKARGFLGACNSARWLLRSQTAAIQDLRTGGPAEQTIRAVSEHLTEFRRSFCECEVVGLPHSHSTLPLGARRSRELEDSLGAEDTYGGGKGGQQELESGADERLRKDD